MTSQASRLIKISGKSYLQVKDRVKGWRDENEAATLVTDILALMPEIGYAAVKATVTLPNGAHADGMGSATSQALKAARKSEDQYLEFAETRAIGRALARLGYGTDDALDDEIPVDAPVEQPGGEPSRPQLRAVASGEVQAVRSESERPTPGPGAATEKQIKAVYTVAHYSRKMSDAQTSAWCVALFGRTPEELSKAEASQLIDVIKDENQSPPFPPAAQPAQPAMESPQQDFLSPVAAAAAVDPRVTLSQAIKAHLKNVGVGDEEIDNALVLLTGIQHRDRGRRTVGHYQQAWNRLGGMSRAEFDAWYDGETNRQPDEI
jgi:hypothetical protein